MLLGANLIFAGSSEEKLLDGVCFYMEGVPAGTSIVGTNCAVTSEGAEWGIDWGDGTGEERFATSGNLTAHTYSSSGDYCIRIFGSGITKIAPRARTSGLYPVIKITSGTDNPYVKRITIGDSFTKFPLAAFTASSSVTNRWNSFSNLKEIVLSNNVKESASAAAFYEMGGAKIIANGLTVVTGSNSFGGNTIADCKDIPQKIVIFSSNYCLAASAIKNLDGFPSNVDTIGTYFFRNCTALANIDSFPKNVKDLPTYSFSGCSSLGPNVSLSYITTIGNYAFYNCTSLKTFRAENATSVGSNVFNGCTALTDIYVKGVGHTNSTTSASNFLTTAIAPNVTLHYVGDVPNYDCRYTTYLIHLNISNAQNVGTYAFNNCTALKNLRGFGGVTTVKEYAFQNCSSLDLSTIDFSGVETIGTGAFAGSGSAGTSVDEIYLPNIKTVNSWGLGVLLDAAKNTTIRFGNKLKTFTGRSLLPVSNTSIPWKNVIFDPGSEFSAVGDRTILQGSKVLICQNDTSLPEGITAIDEYACQYGSVIRLETSNPITYGQYCFRSSALQVVDVSNASFGLGGYEFYDCTYLTSANILLADGSRITDSQRMFSSCNNLKNLYLECGGEGTIGSFFANGCTALTTATVCVGHTITTASVRDRMFCYGGAFKGCSSLQYIYLPNVHHFTDAIGLSAYVSEIFLGCTSMKEVHFGVAHKTEVKSNPNYTTFFGLGSDYTGKIYFDLNPDGTVATNPDGSPIEPDYDGSGS